MGELGRLGRARKASHVGEKRQLSAPKTRQSHKTHEKRVPDLKNLQARTASKAYIKHKLAMELTDGEKRSPEKREAGAR